jgi:hypothetical protein
MTEGSFALEYRPQHWPLRSFHRLHRIEQDEVAVDLVCYPDGHVAVIVQSHGTQKEHHFQRVSIPDGELVKFAFSWSDVDVLASAGGEALCSLEAAAGAVLNIRTKGRATYEMGHFSADFDTLLALPREEWLFVETLGDITRKLASASRYELVRMSALIRQLLCDSTPLARLVNREIKLPLVFEVAIQNGQPIPFAESLQTNLRSLYPDTSEEVVGVDLDRFLKLVAITYKGTDCTVGDVIDVVAHTLGGVHHGQPRTDQDRVLEGLGNELLVHDESAVLHSLHDIGKVTLKALMPLAFELLQYRKVAIYVGENAKLTS